MALKLSRREFTGTAAGSALALVMAGCDKRAALGPDLRAPSAPIGLKKQVNRDSVLFTWDTHAGTDFTGNRTETRINYHVYKDGFRLTATAISEPWFEYPQDMSAVIEAAAFTITAVDAQGNESLPSQPCWIGKPNVFVSQSENAATGSVFNASVVREMVFAAVRACAGIDDTGRAFETFFPGIDSGRTIGIKINTLAGSRLSTHPVVVEAVTEGLALMLGGSYPLANVTVFDDREASKMEAAKFILRSDPAPYRCVSTYGEWSSTGHAIGGTEQRLSRVAESVDYIVNVPVLKDHNVAGVTFALKNMYGIISSPGLMHDNYCDPMVAEVYSLVRSKVRLIVGDALFGAHNNGPDVSPSFAPKALFIGVDPVAMDLHALSVINARRTSGSNPLPAIGYGPTEPARHITTAGSPAYALGDLYSSTREIVLT